MSVVSTPETFVNSSQESPGISPNKFESETKKLVSEIFRVLQSKEQLKDTPQIARAALIEDEVFRRTNLACGKPEEYNLWESSECVSLYRRKGEELVENMKREEGPYWRRVEQNTVHPKHICDKFIPDPQPNKRRRESHTSTGSAPGTPGIAQIPKDVAALGKKSSLAPGVPPLPPSLPSGMSISGLSLSSAASSGLLPSEDQPLARPEGMSAEECERLEKKRRKKERKEKKKEKKKKKEKEREKSSSKILTEVPQGLVLDVIPAAVPVPKDVQVTNLNAWSNFGSSASTGSTSKSLSSIPASSLPSSHLGGEAAAPQKQASLWKDVKETTKQQSLLAEQLKQEDERRKEALRRADANRKAELERIQQEALERQKLQRMEEEKKENEKREKLKAMREAERKRREEMEQTVNMDAQGLVMDKFHDFVSSLEGDDKLGWD